MFAYLARFISRYAKVIVAVWVIAMLIIVPFAAKSFQSSDLSMIGANEAESQEGMDMLHRYFNNTGIEDNPVLVLGYDTPSGLVQFEGNEATGGNIVDYIMYWFSIPDLEWIEKLDPENGTYILDYSITKDSGLVALGFTYRGYTSDQIIEDTPNLRSAVNEAISSYLSTLGVDVKHFNSYVTGNSAMIYDAKDGSMDTLEFALIVVLVIAIVLMGMFFGSIMTSVISVVCIGFSALLTMTLLNFLSSFVLVHSIIWVMTIFLCVTLSFAYCVFFISTYKRQLLDGKDKDHAIENTVIKTGRVYFIVTLCIFLAGIVFCCSNGMIICSLGLGLISTMISVVLVSSMIPASLICITKNELFWTRSIDGAFKAISLEKYYRFFERLSNTITSRIDSFLRRRYIPVIVVVAIITLGSAVYVVSSEINSKDYDLTDSMMVGESAAGIDELKDHSMGGVFQPYTIVLECKSDIGHIEKYDGIPGVYGIQWTSDTEISSINSELKRFSSMLFEADSNIYNTVTIEIWDELVQKARDEGLTDPTEIIGYIESYLGLTNVIAYQGLEKGLEILRIIYSDQYIVDYCGPELDYMMNIWLSDIGYEMTSDGKVPIEYIAMSVFIKSTCTSEKSTETSKNIDDCTNRFIATSEHFSNHWVCGIAVMYDNVYHEISTMYSPLVLVIIILIFAVLFIAEREFSVPVSIAATSLVTVFISLAIIIAVLSLTIGTISNTTLMMMPIFAITFSLWFAYMQIAMMRECGTISKMKNEFNPVIIVTSIVIAFGSLLLVLSDVDYISRMGLAVAVMMLVDAFIVRLLLAPAVWRFGIEHNVKYFERYSKE